jgi:hypothetical protein
MAGRLLELFGGQRTTRSTDTNRPKPAPAERVSSSPDAAAAATVNDLVEYPPPRVPAKPK